MSRSLLPVKRNLIRFPFGHFPSVWDELEDESLAEETGLSVSEDEKCFYVEAQMPGLDLKEIDITLDKGVLWICGEKKEEVEDKKRKFHRKALCSFSYRLSIPTQINESSEPTAKYKDGILSLTFQKTNKGQTRKIPVKKG